MEPACVSCHNYYHGKIGFIAGDNELKRWLAQESGDPFVPEFEYLIDVPTYDGEDIEHTHARPDEIKVVM